MTPRLSTFGLNGWGDHPNHLWNKSMYTTCMQMSCIMSWFVFMCVIYPSTHPSNYVHSYSCIYIYIHIVDKFCIFCRHTSLLETVSSVSFPPVMTFLAATDRHAGAHQQMPCSQHFFGADGEPWRSPGSQGPRVPGPQGPRNREMPRVGHKGVLKWGYP